LLTIVNLEGKIVEGELNPSTDTPTHLELYKAFPGIGGIAHTHSTYATVWAQLCKELPCYGTTHADFFYGAVPVTRQLTAAEVKDNYEQNTGKVIVELFKEKNPLEMPAVLVANHGPFTWGANAAKSVENSIVLEEVSKMALWTKDLIEIDKSIPDYLLDKHYLRKHGSGAYYGQK